MVIAAIIPLFVVAAVVAIFVTVVGGDFLVSWISDSFIAVLWVAGISFLFDARPYFKELEVSI